VKIIKGPYLQFSNPEEMIVLWETDVPGPSRVDYGQTATFGHYIDQTAPVTLHRVVLRALALEGIYHYQIRSGDVQAGPFTFRSAVHDSTPFTFAVFGDSRTSAEQSSAVGRQMASHQPHFLLHSGDLVSNGAVYEQWEEQFFSPLGEVLARIPFFPVLGNHEQNSVHFYNFFPSGSWYSFEYGNACFIALDTNTASGGFEPGTEQYGWLQRTLEETSALWRIVWFHHPPYSSGNHGCSIEQQEALAPLLERYQVDMVFNGHDHIYERSFPMRAGRREDESGIIYVVTGGGGAPLYPVDAGEWTGFATSTHHYCAVSIDGPHLRLQVCDLNGDVVDYCWRCKDPAFVAAQVDQLQDPASRPDAIYNLGALCHRDAVPVLLPFIGDNDVLIRQRLAETLARIGESWAREALEELSSDDAIDTIRWASFGLAQIARKSPSHALADLLQHPDAPVRRHASQGLKFIAADWALKALSAAIGDSDVMVRRNVARALAPAPHEVDAAFWRVALTDDDDMVRVAALQAIQGLEGIEELSDILHQHLQHDHTPTRRAAVQTLSLQPHMDSLGFFLTVLHDEDPLVRQHATQALQELTGELLHERPEAWRWWFKQQADET
jgi:HEAT repeat protein